MILFAKWKQRDTDVENERTDTKGEGSERHREIGMDTYTRLLPRVKPTTQEHAVASTENILSGL